MKLTIKKKRKGYTVKTANEVEENLSYGEMLTKVRWELIRIQDGAAPARKLTGEELLQKVMALNTPSPSPIFNKHGYDLRYFLPDGWDGVDSEFDFIAIDGNGDIYIFAKKPVLCNKSQKWDIFEFGSLIWQLTKINIPQNINWQHLIWAHPKTTQP